MIFVLPSETLWIYPDGNNTEPLHFTSPRIEFLDSPAPAGYWDSYNVTAQFIYTADKNIANTTDITGKILLYVATALEREEDCVALFAGSGIAAFFTVYRQTSDYPGIGNWVRSGHPFPIHEFPVYEITKVQLNAILEIYNSQPILMMTVHSDPNPWQLTFTTVLPALGIVLLIMSGVIAIMATYKLIILIQHNGAQLSVPQVILWFNIIACILRGMWTASDPFGAYGTTTFLVSQIGFSISYPFGVASCLLLALYWHELIKRTGKRINLFLDRLKWPFLIVSALMFAFEVATATLRGLDASFLVVTLIDGLFYVVITIAVVVFFCITRYRIQEVFNRLNRGLKNRNDSKLKLATGYLQAICVFGSIWVIILVIVGLTNLAWNPTAFCILWWIFFPSQTMVNLLQVITIRVPNPSWKLPFLSFSSDDTAEVTNTPTEELTV